MASSHLILALQALVSRESNPVDQVVISITSIHGGTAFNIIPEAVELKGTLRTFLPETRDRLQRRIGEVAQSVANTFGASTEIVWHHGSPAVVNDHDEVARLRQVAAAVVGADQVKTSPQIMGGDDMALWLQQAKGAYFFVGSRGSEASAWPHHHPRFDIDEASLPIAVEIFASGVAELLRA